MNRVQHRAQHIQPHMSMLNNCMPMSQMIATKAYDMNNCDDFIGDYGGGYGGEQEDFGYDMLISRGGAGIPEE